MNKVDQPFTQSNLAELTQVDSTNDANRLNGLSTLGKWARNIFGALALSVLSGCYVHCSSGGSISYKYNRKSEISFCIGGYSKKVRKQKLRDWVSKNCELGFSRSFRKGGKECRVCPTGMRNRNRTNPTNPNGDSDEKWDF